MEGSLVAYKVFTNGSVLNASEVNDNLMNQAVITFTNSTARASAITSPIEGMLTYLADTDTYQFWNGTAWTNLVSPGESSGLVRINGATFTGVTSFSLATGTFSSTYDNYLILINVDPTSGGSIMSARFRIAGSDNSTSNYRWTSEERLSNSATYNYNRANPTDNLRIGYTEVDWKSTALVNVNNPFLTKMTTTQSMMSAATSSSAYDDKVTGAFTATTSFDSMTFTLSGNMTGSVNVYGYKKA
jgi:hypothetical protein